jgi:glycerol-3-phosphate acyltransferase PlsX
MLKSHLSSSLLSRMGTLLAQGAFRRFRRFTDYSEYGGAPLLGLQSIALVCHGSANARAISRAVDMAAAFVDNQANDHLRERLAEMKELEKDLHISQATDETAGVTT